MGVCVCVAPKMKIQSDVFHSVAWLLHLVLFVVLCYRGVYKCVCVATLSISPSAQ